MNNATAVISRQGRTTLAARLLINRLVAAGVSRIELMDAQESTFVVGLDQEGVPVPRIHLHSARPLWRGATNGLLGWAESYMAEEWSCSSLIDVTEWAMANESALERVFSGTPISRLVNRFLHRLQDNTRSGSRRNITYHYDLGNAFYKQWLDPSMTYSAARFSSEAQTLADAQTAKYQQVLDWAQIAEADRLLEIGCGWGGFADHALAKTAFDYHGITLSDEQLAYARERLANRPARFELRDYRDLDQQYDAIVSIEMLEAVGEQYWDTYFDMVHRSLRPGGRAVIQVITIDDDRFEDYRRGADFIQRYIFPGGMLPCDAVLDRQIERVGMRIVEDDRFGADYARTLAAWRASFEAAWPKLKAMGFDERFRRMWRWYLCYCESGFRDGSINVRMMALQKD